jgi:DHA2 family multidrug resistance protein
MIWWGLPQDKPDYGRFRVLDWRGVVLLIIGFGAFSTMLQQGDRFDWFNSPFISVLALASVIAIPLFLLNEWFTDPPLMRLQLLGRRNMAYGLIAIFTFLLISQSGSTLPNNFLSQVQGFRPEQLFPLTLIVALAQIPLLPATAWLLDRPSIDARLVSLVGMLLILVACLNSTLISGDWYPGALIVSQALQAVGQPMIIMPLLMMATNSVRSPDEAPFAASMVNTPRALAEAVGVWLTQLIERWRGGLHYNRIADQLGQERFQLPSLMGGTAPPGSLAPLGEAVQAQATVLTLSDIYMVYAALTVALIVVLAILPEHTLPPRLQLAAKE